MVNLYCARLVRISALIACSNIVIETAYAEDGIDFLKPIVIELEEYSETEKKWDWLGYIQQDVKYGFKSPPTRFSRNKPGVSQVKTHAFIQGSGHFSERLSWQASVKIEHEWLDWNDNKSEWRSNNQEVFLKDLYLDATFDNGLWLRLGHQVVAWGESEALVITDVISPIDQREPGQAELKDSREQVPALLAFYPITENIHFTTVITNRANTNRYANRGDSFDVQGAYIPESYDIKQSPNESDWEIAARLEGRFNGSDIHLIAARVNDNNLGLDYIESGTVYVFQNRFSVYGLSANRVLGNGLLRTELAFWKKALEPSLAVNTTQFSNQVRSMLGYDYSFAENWQLAVEMNNTHISSELQSSARTKISSLDHFGYTFRIQHSALNNTLMNQLWLAKLGVEDAHIARWNVDYDWSDRWKFGLSMIMYSFGHRKSMLKAITNHDSINAQITFSL